MKSVSSIFAAVIVLMFARGPVQAQDVYPSRILSFLLRNLPGAEFTADPEFVALLKAGGMKPDLADIVALGMSPTMDGPLGPTLPATVVVDGECQAENGGNPECRLRFLQRQQEPGDDGESALILIFRLDRAIDESGARIIGPVRVEIAG